MAQFTRVYTFEWVMNTLIRRCKYYKGGCPECGLHNCPNCVPLHNTQDVDTLLKDIVEWYKSHPEPVYPTWYEWLFNQVRKKNEWPVSDHEFCKWLSETNIPWDIAQKLGIKPKEQL